MRRRGTDTETTRRRSVEVQWIVAQPNRVKNFCVQLLNGGARHSFRVFEIHGRGDCRTLSAVLARPGKRKVPGARTHASMAEPLASQHFSFCGSPILSLLPCRSLKYVPFSIDVLLYELVGVLLIAFLVHLPDARVPPHFRVLGRPLQQEDASTSLRGASISSILSSSTRPPPISSWN